MQLSSYSVWEFLICTFYCPGGLSAHHSKAGFGNRKLLLESWAGVWYGSWVAVDVVAVQAPTVIEGTR